MERSRTEIDNEERQRLKREEEMYTEIAQEDDAQPVPVPVKPQSKPHYLGIESWDQDT